MNKYWFKKYGKGGAFPVTWEGWAYFAFVIALVTQASNILATVIEVGVLESALATGLVAAIGFYGMRFKTNPNEQFDKVKDKGTYKQLWGALIGILIFVALLLIAPSLI